MKKKLEADLISIAHRILQLKNKSDINQLYLETQKLYEKLTVLQFVENHFSEAKPTIGLTEVSQELESIFNEEIAEIETIPAVTTLTTPEATIEETVIETVEEEPSVVELEAENETEVFEMEQEETEVAIEHEQAVSEIDTELTFEPQLEAEAPETIKVPEVAPTTDFTPSFSFLADEVEDAPIETTKKAEAVQISFEDLLGGNYHDTLFVKKTETSQSNPAVPTSPEAEKKTVIMPEVEVATITAATEKTESKSVSLNDMLAKGINIDLNDRLAFIKHLFANSSDDYNRVLSQINTFKTFYETRDFVQEMVKPDYNNWEGKQEYEDRFMEIIEKKFL